MDTFHPQIGRRYRQVRDLLRSEGAAGVVERAQRAVAERLNPKNTIMPVRRADVMAADLSNNSRPAIHDIVYGEPLIANWVITPPSRNSGGHTTLFRMIRYLQEHGYNNRVYLYNAFGADHQYFESIVRDSYGFRGPVCNLNRGMEDAHAVFATAWPTAYPVFNSPCKGKRFYFVQDYEPHFHPVGALSLLAENTYHMGFHAITAGRWLAVKLREECNSPADSFEFGCDTSVYRIRESSQRTGLVFYARPEAPRRGFELGMMAMETFAARNPSIDMHFYGERMGKLPFSVIDHGRVNPERLNEIYNKCFAGLSLSLTNVSLVPHEMLAAGCIPVVNEARQNRIVLDNPFIRYAQPYPEALAAALEEVVQDPDFNSLSRSAAASVRGVTWSDAGATVDGIVRSALENEVNARRCECLEAVNGTS